MQQPTRSEVRWEWISQGWELFTAQWQNWLVIGLVYFVVIIAVNGPASFFSLSQTGLLHRGNPSAAISISEIAASGSRTLGFFVNVITGAIQLILLAGLYRAALKQIRGGQVSISDTLMILDSIVPISITALVLSILFNLGLALCLIPGFIVQGLLLFVMPIVVDKNVGLGEALKLSFEATKSSFVMFVLFAIVIDLIWVLGFVMCCVGLVVIIPFCSITIALAYNSTFGGPGAFGPDSYSPPPPPNFGGYEPPPPPPASWQ